MPPAAIDDAVKCTVLELQDEEREQVELVREWLQKAPKPDAGSANNPDPPRHAD